MKKIWIKKGLMFLVIFIAAITAFGFIVMGLWNALLPGILGVKAISFWQALGLLLLSKILFGGFGGKRWRGSPAWKEKMKQRCEHMSPEEKEKFKTEWKNRCGGRWGHTTTNSSTTENTDKM